MLAVIAAFAFVAVASPAHASTIQTPRATPIGNIQSVYRSGTASVFGDVIVFGPNKLTTTPNATRVIAPDGNPYAIVGFNGEFFAVGETNGFVWDTHGQPYGDSSVWTPMSILSLFTFTQWVNAWPKPMFYELSRVAPGLFYQPVFFWLLSYYWDSFGNDAQKAQMTQWNNVGFILFDYAPFVDTAGGAHNGLWTDIHWLATNVSGLRSQLGNAGSRELTWVDTSQLP